MAMTIDETCIACGACEPECPTKAISEGEDIFVIDAKLCVECIGHFDSPKCVEVCPTDSIHKLV
jgi:ferredoxin